MQRSCSSRLAEFSRCTGVSSVPACRLMKASILTKDAVTAEQGGGRWDLLISHLFYRCLSGSPAECAAYLKD